MRLSYERRQKLLGSLFLPSSKLKLVSGEAFLPVQVMDVRTRECTTEIFVLCMSKFRSFSELSVCKYESLRIILETSVWKCLNYAFPGNVTQEETLCKC